jgi:hypothetical protein
MMKRDCAILEAGQVVGAARRRRRSQRTVIDFVHHAQQQTGALQRVPQHHRTGLVMAAGPCSFDDVHMAGSCSLLMASFRNGPEPSFMESTSLPAESDPLPKPAQEHHQRENSLV